MASVWEERMDRLERISNDRIQRAAAGVQTFTPHAHLAVEYKSQYDNGQQYVQVFCYCAHHILVKAGERYLSERLPKSMISFEEAALRIEYPTLSEEGRKKVKEGAPAAWVVSFEEHQRREQR